MEKIAVIGAGLVGSILSVYMARRGYAVDLFERRPDMRKIKTSGGRSINLAVSERGWGALADVGLDDKVRHAAVPMRGRMIHGRDGRREFSPYGVNGEAIYSISWEELTAILLDAAAAERNVNIHFGEKLARLDLRNGVAWLDNQKTKNRTECVARVILGADGTFSAVRGEMQRTDHFDYSQTYLKHGYKELTIPPAKEGKWAIEPNALHVWPRGEYMLIALPNNDGSFTCTLFLPFEGTVSFDHLQSPEAAHALFEGEFPDALSLMPNLRDEWSVRPVSSLCAIRCFPWSFRDKALLVGDAAHTIAPFYGQGMNAGFEDCTILDRCLTDFGGDWARAIKEYERLRKPDVDAIADLSIENFVEMRDRIRDDGFLLRKKLEREAQRIAPDKFMTLYSMVTFSRIPYAQALARSRSQDRLIDRLMGCEGIEATLKNGGGEGIVRKILEDEENGKGSDDHGVNG